MLNNFGPWLGCLVLFRGVASSILPRANDNANGHQWINHDAVVPFTQSAADGLGGDLELRFNPYLWVSGGCDPYPAVDGEGNLGAGLKPTGGGRSGCGAGGKGQVYARRGMSNDRNGIMYSYYTPKVRWAKGDSNGHRHYWASVVVWVNRWGCDEEDITSIWPVGVSYTTDHLNWGTSSAAGGDISFRAADVGLNMPTHAKMQIHDNAMSPFKNADGENIFERTLISWESLPTLAKDALTDVRYEKTQVPFNDANFQAQMDAAYQEAFFVGVAPSKCDPVEGPKKVDTPDDPPVTATTRVPKPQSTDA
ncbi:NPP1 domain-containing protein [Colletotrichum salicis]|uniref:NPP1 domain-containing protein n=1 Tax=Colletotrichum salicis TaxID=1209931 RepID=A0A135UK14_9PEZI|nr:NPP1 domain-containing protein [Colletotrichum salicis]